MSGHDNSYVIRLPDRFWQRLVDLKYIDNNVSEKTAEAFNTARRGRLSSGHARYITGSHRTVCRILAQLHTLAAEIAAGEYRARETFGVNRANIEYWANQRIALAVDVRIISEPDESEGDMT